MASTVKANVTDDQGCLYSHDPEEEKNVTQGKGPPLSLSTAERHWQGPQVPWRMPGQG